MSTIVRNRAKCLLCRDVIESKSRHQFVTCTCAALYVDGGTAYLRRGATDLTQFEELSEVQPEPCTCTHDRDVHTSLWREDALVTGPCQECPCHLFATAASPNEFI